MSTPESSPDLEDIIEGDASEEDIEAYNEAKDAEMEARIGQLEDEEQEAVEALLDEAEETAETETVTLESGLELEVRTRVPPAVERKQQRLRTLEKRHKDGEADIRDIAEVSCEMLAEMCETDGYDNPDVWLAAYQREGQQWLLEMVAEVTEPAKNQTEQLGNRLDR